MDRYETRRIRLTELRDKRCGGNTSELARRLDRNPTYVLRMLYPEGKPGRKRIADAMAEVINKAFNLPVGWLDGLQERRTILVDEYMDADLNIRGIPDAAQDHFSAPDDCTEQAHAVQLRTKMMRVDGWIVVLSGVNRDPKDSLTDLCAYCMQDGKVSMGVLSKGYLTGTFNVAEFFTDTPKVRENVRILWTQKVLWIKP